MLPDKSNTEFKMEELQQEASEEHHEQIETPANQEIEDEDKQTFKTQLELVNQVEDKIAEFDDFLNNTSNQLSLCD